VIISPRADFSWGGNFNVTFAGAGKDLVSEPARQVEASQSIVSASSSSSRDGV